MQDYIQFKLYRERYYSNCYAKRFGQLKMESNYSTDNIPEIALSWAALGEPVVLATVVETWGSAPRRVGAQMAWLKWKNAGFSIGRMYRERSCVRSRRDNHHKKD